MGNMTHKLFNTKIYKPYLGYLLLIILLCFVVQYSIYNLTSTSKVKAYESLFFFNDSLITNLQTEYIKPISHFLINNVTGSKSFTTPVISHLPAKSYLSRNFPETLNVTSHKVEIENSTNGDNALPCPPVPPDLIGPVKVSLKRLSFEDLEKNHPELSLGGRFQPSSCISRHKVAIIIPYRARPEHLRVFLHNIHSFLQRQQINYGIYVVEQADHYRFNRAKLFNIGFQEASKLYDWHCFIFHDVDLLPEDDRNLYTCPEQPRHMSVAVDVFNYKLPYVDIFGGVSAVNAKHFKLLNGYSNRFWGWGGEDDDMSNRIKYHGLHISRYPPNVARYKMIFHDKDPPNPRRYDVLTNGKRRFVSDGLKDLKYIVKDVLLKRLYTWVYVDLVGPK